MPATPTLSVRLLKDASLPIATASHVPPAVKITVLVPAEKWLSSFHPPPTFHVFVDPATVTEERLMSTAPLVNEALFCVAVPAPELASKVTVLVDVGVQAQLAPPDAFDHFVVSLKFPVPPIQKQEPPARLQLTAAASPVAQPKRT